jgi:PPE-repeat protein
MWAQDAAAMYGYAGASAAATQLRVFAAPPQTTSSTGLAAQLVSTLPSALQSLSSPLASGSAADTTGLSGLLNLFSGSDTALGQFLNANVWNTLFSSGFYMPSNTIAPFLGLAGGADAAGEAAAGATEQAAGSVLGDAVAAPVGDIGAGTVSAALAQAPRLGPLSVPPSWTAPSVLAGSVVPAAGGTPMVAPPPAVAAGMPGGPPGSATGRGYGRAVPQYGVRPSFVARPPAAG